jgi:hypothetical protein
LLRKPVDDRSSRGRKWVPWAKAVTGRKKSTTCLQQETATAGTRKLIQALLHKSPAIELLGCQAIVASRIVVQLFDST